MTETTTEEIAPNTFGLAKPINAHGESISVLTFREPTGKDIRKIGTAFKYDAAGGLSFDAEAVAKYISVLANIPPSSVDELSAKDFQMLLGVILGFFT